ncbi:MAG: tetratricopeptide repeat protein [Treponema sp.]|nr:tetratricopeptide repeat protein [Treponema sp.]MCL2271542.1 tetratricopeptide repeat protein [Treponema sp.]
MVKNFNRNICLVFFSAILLLLAPFLYAQDSTEVILNDVIALLAGRNFSSALELFDKLDPQVAQDTGIQILRASISNSAGRPAEAIQIANRIIALDGNNTDALMILADSAALQNREHDRRRLLERIISISPAHARALTDLGNLSLGSRNLHVAAGYFDRALAAEPENGEALVGRAVIYRYDRESRNSERLLNRAASLYPAWARPLHERARLYRSAGFHNDALEDLDLALELENENYWIITDRGQVLMDMGRKQEALAAFARAIEIEPNAFLAYVFSAGIKDELGDYAGSEKDYVKLAGIRPDYYFAFEAIGIFNMKNKNWAKARDAFLDAYKQAPSELTYAMLAAVCWMRAGRQTDPKQFIAQVLRTVPRDSFEYAILRLYHDLSGDLDVANRIETEKNADTKARMIFYLASFYDIRGNTNLANRYYSLMQEQNAAVSVEWRLNEWILEERNLGLKVNK